MELAWTLLVAVEFIKDLSFLPYPPLKRIISLLADLKVESKNWMWSECKLGYLAYFTDNLKLQFCDQLCMRKCTTVLEISQFSKPRLVCVMVCWCAVQSWQMESGSTISMVLCSCVGCAPALPGVGLCSLQVNLVLAGSEDSLPYFHYMQQISPNYVSLKVNIPGLSLLFCCVTSFRLDFWRLFFFWIVRLRIWILFVWSMNVWIWKCGIKITMKCNETHGWLIRVRRAGGVSYS